MENINPEIPNSPVSIGSNGCSMYRFKEAIPKNPEIVKKIIVSIVFFSPIIKRTQIQNNTQGIIFSKNGYTAFNENVSIGVTTNTSMVPISAPMDERNIAVFAFPDSNNSCAGWIDREVSSFGAPRKVVGIKSKNTVEIDMETINITRGNGSVKPRKNGSEVIRNEEMRFV